MSGRRISGNPFAGGINRRRFVQGLVAGGLIAGFDVWRLPAFALTNRNEQTALTGDRFDLAIEEVAVNFTGRPGVATAMNGSVPAPLLRWREGDTVTLAVTNRLRVPTSIHWHGLRIPADMDGVPGLSFPGIAPGETFAYRFLVQQSGTYWYHSHSRFQEQTGHYGPIIIEPRDKDRIQFDREYVILLSDWTDENPETVFSNIKQQSAYYNFHQRTVGTFISDVRTKGLGATISDRLMWGSMNMNPTDVLDVSGATYTYLINGQPPAANWTALFRPRERIRLRFINGSSMSIFDVRIPGLPMTVVQADGNDVEPVTVDEFRISVAETYDVIVQPHDESAFTIFAQSEDRTGYARATLAPRSGMTAAVPPMDPRPLLTMVDMGMGDMSGMDMARTDGPSKGDMAGMNMGGHGGAEQSKKTGPEMESMPGMKMGPAASAPSATPGMKMNKMQSMDMSGMPGMKMGSAAPTPSATPGMKMNKMHSMDMSGMPGMKMGPAASMPSATPGMKMNKKQSMDMSGMPGMKIGAKPPSKPPEAGPAVSRTAGYGAIPFPQPGPDTAGASVPSMAGQPTPPKPTTLREGPQVDNIATMPTERLAEPGNGLNDNGRRVLTYADLRARYRGVDARPPDREIELHLTGNMERFIWGFNGQKFSDAEPLRFKLGERVRIILINDTMMEHPIHLHGLWSELENEHADFRPYKHTINVKGGERLSYLVSADTPGKWAYHCHLLYHMEAGMFRTVIVE